VKRLLPLLLALTSVVLCAPSAQASLRQGGYDEATRQLEAGFKVVGTQRVFSDDECYPSPDAVADLLRRQMGVEVVVTSSLDSVQGFGLVNVIRDITECNRLVLAIRAGLKGRVFVLDSDHGPVYLQGLKAVTEESLAGGVGPLRDLTAATSGLVMHKPDATSRFEVHCPLGTSPLGGGMFNVTPVGGDGDGVYPHSYERLGVQGGFHVTATYVHPSGAASTRRRGLLQVICGRGLVPTASPHTTTFVRRHGTGTVTARCPQGTQLFSGGFQRTNFTTPGVSHGGVMYGGNYITESRAVGTTAWRVSAGAVDLNGGELTAIAYCGRDPSLPLTEVSASTSVGQGEAATAVAPACPDDRALVAGGFSFDGSHDALFADGYFTREGTWAATGYGWFGSAELTAYGYCAKARDTVDRSAFPEEPRAQSWADGHRAVIYTGLGLLGLVLVGFLRRRQVVRRRRRRRRARPGKAPSQAAAPPRPPR
jgi:hypothetical protein